MLDLKCYDRMNEALLEETVKNGHNAQVDMLSQMLLGKMEDVLEEHKYAAYWDEFEKQATDQHLAYGLIMSSVANLYKSFFYAFEGYVEEQLEAENE